MIIRWLIFNGMIHKWVRSILGMSLSGLLLLWLCGCQAQILPLSEQKSQYQRLSKTLGSQRAIISIESWKVPEYVSSSCGTGIKIDTVHYEIYTTTMDEQMLGKTIEFMESAFWAYSNVIKKHIILKKKLKIYFFQTRQQWEEFTFQWTGSQAPIYLKIRSGGYYYNGVCIAYDLQSRASLCVLAHEGWHQFSDAVFRYRLPAWLDEGLATNFEGFQEHDGLFEFDPKYNTNRLTGLNYAIYRGALIRISEVLTTDAGRLLSKPEHGFSGSQTTKLAAYYAQLYALIRFLQEYNNSQYLPNFHKMIEDAYLGQWKLEPQLAVEALQGQQPSRRWNYEVSKFIFQNYITSNPSDIIPEYEAFCRKITQSYHSQKIQ